MKRATSMIRNSTFGKQTKLLVSKESVGKNPLFPLIIKKIYSPFKSFSIGTALENMRSNLFYSTKKDGIVISESRQKDRKRIEDALQQSEDRYRTLVEKAPIGIYTITKEGIIDSFNPKMVELAGVESPHQVIGLNAFNMPSYKRVGLDKLFSKGLRGKAFEAEVPYISHIGKKESFRYYRGVPLYSNDGKRVERLLLIVEDITKRKQLEKQKDDFTSLVTHELKNPISTISGYVQLLQNQLKTLVDQKPLHYLSNIEDQIHTVTNLINGLFSATRLRAKSFRFYEEQVNIDELLKKTIERLQTTNRSRRIILKGKSKKTIYADKERIAQVIINLVQNALRYSPQGKKVIVCVSADEKHVLLSVQDFGIGIAKQYQKKIFKRFFQINSKERTHPLGMGLGLHIATEILKHYKGKMWVESKEGKGSNFYVSLPLKKQHTAG